MHQTLTFQVILLQKIKSKLDLAFDKFENEPTEEGLDKYLELFEEFPLSNYLMRIISSPNFVQRWRSRKLDNEINPRIYPNFVCEFINDIAVQLSVIESIEINTEEKET